jgi:hypothetical protein
MCGREHYTLKFPGHRSASGETTVCECGLFHDAVYITSNGRLTDEFKRILKEVSVVLSWYVPGRTEENHQNM